MKAIHSIVGGLIVSLCMLSRLQAQYVLNVYTTDDGLISNDVTCTYRDSRGFLWIGSKEGLQVYNGKYFRNIRHHLLDSNSLSGDWVLSIAEDAKGFIWVGTDNGICKIHPGHLRCTRYEPGKKMRKEVNPYQSKVVADDRGRIWALTANYLLMNEGDSFICKEPVKYPGNLCMSSDHQLLITVFDQVLIKNTETGVVIKPPLQEKSRVDYTCSYRDKLGNYWLGSWGTGLIIHDANWKNHQSFIWDINPSNPSTTNIVSSINGDDHHVYVGTSNGFFIYDLDEPIDLSAGLLFNYTNPDKKNMLPFGTVGHISIDVNRNIWLATSTGLNVSMALNSTYSKVTSGTGFITDMVWNDQQLIASSWYGKGIYFMDGNMQITQTIQYLPEYTDQLDNSQISGLDMDDREILWIATFNGLVKYDLASRKTVDYFTKEKNGLPTNRLNDVWFNKTENEVWTANYDDGITRINLATGKAVQLNMKNSSFIPADLIWSFYDGGNGIEWILTNDGIVNYNCHSKKWNCWKEISFNSSKIRIGKCNAMLKDRLGTIWLGTENGLFVYVNQNWLFKGVENGLPERSINSIAQDSKGRIWIGFDHSLLNFDPGSFSSFILSSYNDILLPAVEFIFINPNNDRLFLVSEHEIYEIDTDSLLATHTVSPKVYLEKFLINGKSCYSITDSFTLEKKEFSFDQNNVEIGFVTPSIGEIGKLLYSYRIGANGLWSDPSENNQIILPKLQPGSYQVEIRATTDGVHWSNKPLRIAFKIRPPFWTTWWFRSLIGVMSVLTIAWWVRFISTRKMKLKILRLEKEQAIEKERSRLSRDMHDDLGSGLTKISILSEVVKKKVKEEAEVDAYLENISDSSRELVQNLNNIIWSLSPGNDKIQALTAYIREYAAKFLESCQVGFEVNTDQINMDQEVPEQVKRNIFLVVKESLNNAVKHGKSTKVILNMEIKNGSALQIIITDNGVGMNSQVSGSGNGLKNMEKRMKDIQGSFSIESERDKGTRVTLSYPL